MYLHTDPEGLKSLHRSYVAERVGERKGWLRWSIDFEA